jgi:hypothetical protein
VTHVDAVCSLATLFFFLPPVGSYIETTKLHILGPFPVEFWWNISWLTAYVWRLWFLKYSLRTHTVKRREDGRYELAPRKKKRIILVFGILYNIWNCTDILSAIRIYVPRSGSFAIDCGSCSYCVGNEGQKVTCLGFPVLHLRYSDIAVIPKLFVLPESATDEIMP